MIQGWDKLEKRWRKQLLSNAKGEVLDIDVEGGTNFCHYPVGVHVTGICTGKRMSDEAMKQAKRYGIEATMIVTPVEESNFQESSFDTIVSTFALSAYDSPVQVLSRISKWCKPDGTILLLEYGISDYQVIRWMQRGIQSLHYRRTGEHICHDLLTVIKESGLAFKKIEMKFAGSVYMIWACIKQANKNIYLNNQHVA